jgi:hypothetical protein
MILLKMACLTQREFCPGKVVEIVPLRVWRQGIYVPIESVFEK